MFLDQLSSEFIASLKRPIVLTNGCFDILHIGHVRYLQGAKNLGLTLVVGTNSDRSVKILKGDSRPVNVAEHRAELLNALRCVDHAIIFDELTADELIRTIKPNIYVKAGDYCRESLPELKTLDELKVEIVILPFEAGHSTSAIIELLQG